MAEPAIFDASAGDGDEWAERALSGKHKGPLSVADAQEQLGLAAHPSMGEVGGGATIRAANFRVSAGYARAIALSLEHSPDVTAVEFSNASLDALALGIIVAALLWPFAKAFESVNLEMAALTLQCACAERVG